MIDLFFRRDDLNDKMRFNEYDLIIMLDLRYLYLFIFIKITTHNNNNNNNNEEDDNKYNI
jgi:hypothetical protein